MSLEGTHLGVRQPHRSGEQTAIGHNHFRRFRVPGQPVLTDGIGLHIGKTVKSDCRIYDLWV